MVLLILKSSACLVVFMVFYKLFLEKESIHHFKRFYLLGALLVSVVIPFITFTQYIEVEPIQDFVPFQPLEFSTTESLILEDIFTWQDYIPTVLWSVYFIGVLLFSFRFALNLREILHRIKNNPKHQYHEFTNVLLQDLIPPHTFFKYIFLNKTKYEQNLIPNEVLLHEQTHAKQKHALDILCIEVLQIAFWFNPLLYFIKKDIKLNHEFLADRTVLDKGISAIQYKETLLAFSSPDNYRDAKTHQLANAINYSLIKKRFTVMKTQTSKQAIWFRSLILLPILAILIYSFSEKEIIEKEVASIEPEIEHQKQSLTAKTKLYNHLIKNRLEQENILNESSKKDSTKLILLQKRIDIVRKDIDILIKTDTSNKSIEKRLNEVQQKLKVSISILIKNNNELLVNGKTCKLGELEKRIDELTKKLSIEEKEKLTPAIIYDSSASADLILKIKNVLRQKGIYKVNSSKKGLIVNYEKGIIKVVETNEDFQQKATPEQLVEYNKLAKRYNKQPEDKRIVKLKDLQRLESIYKLMTNAQKDKAEPFPNCPPLPPISIFL